ncbi:transcriptional repressor LexA [Neobacillus vireti]|uniref:transcriptional repressor LexA n=1 Tax=Neobacillus vireti TaxID=220686 RepID=UPI003000B1AA
MPKRFGDYLRKLRNEKGLSIRQLEKLSGVSNAYISQMETGKRGIPTPDVLKKIQEPLGVEYDELMQKAGYITPETRSLLLPETIETLESYEELNELIDNAAEIFFGSVEDDDGMLKHTFRQILLNEDQNLSEEQLDELVHDPDIKDKLFSHLTVDEKIYFLNSIIKDFVERNIDPSKVLKSTEQKISENKVPILTVPVLGYIAAGQPILAQEHIEDWIEIPNMWNLKTSEVLVLKVKGDSMIGSRIYEGDKVVVKIQPDVENGEIAVVNINGDEATLKKVKKTESGQVILWPDNPKYEPTFVNNENARIIGKVIQVMFEP